MAIGMSSLETTLLVENGIFIVPATLSFGLSEFTKKVGEKKARRRLEEKKQKVYKSFRLKIQRALIKKLFKTQKTPSFI